MGGGGSAAAEQGLEDADDEERGQAPEQGLAEDEAGVVGAHANGVSASPGPLAGVRPAAFSCFRGASNSATSAAPTASFGSRSKARWVWGSGPSGSRWGPGSSRPSGPRCRKRMDPPRCSAARSRARNPGPAAGGGSDRVAGDGVVVVAAGVEAHPGADLPAVERPPAVAAVVLRDGGGEDGAEQVQVPGVVGAGHGAGASLLRGWGVRGSTGGETGWPASGGPSRVGHHLHTQNTCDLDLFFVHLGGGAPGAPDRDHGAIGAP